jgi:predicted nucleic-acid-binding protein
MIGLDTNVLVRYFLEDDARQAAAAKRFVDAARAQGESLFINRVVLAELTWVLFKPYKLGREEVADAIERILYTTQFVVEGKEFVWESLRTFRSSSADFADCLIGAVNKDADCTTTVTFDRKTEKLETFKLL